MQLHKLTLIVKSADREDVYRDVARIPVEHRNGLKAGHMYKISRDGLFAFVFIRGAEGSKAGKAIKLDEVIRNKLGVELGKEYEFKIESINWFTKLLGAWYTTDPFNRVAIQLSIVSAVLGVISLFVALIPFVHAGLTRN